MLLIEYIVKHYGDKRGNKAAFLRDNTNIRPQELTRMLNVGKRVDLQTGDIYKPSTEKIENLKS